MYLSQYQELPAPRTSVIPTRITFVGRQAALTPSHYQQLERELAAEHGTRWDGRWCHMVAAADTTAPGFRTIVDEPDWHKPLYADGIVLAGHYRRSAVVLQLADCLGIVMYRITTGTVAVGHAGRPALTPRNGSTSDTIVTDMMHSLGYRPGESVTDVCIYVSPGISGRSFSHSTPDAAAKIEPFRSYHEHHPERKILGGTQYSCLDLRAWTLFILKTLYAIPDPHIIVSRECTFDTKTLSSYRRGDTCRNTLAVVL